MTQTRTFLLIAWLVIAFLLWDAWQKDNSAPVALSSPTTSSEAAIPAATATHDGSVPETGSIPSAHVSSMVPSTEVEAPVSSTVVLENDVLRLTLDGRGGTVLVAELLNYAQQPKGEKVPVQLLSQESASYFVAQNGLVGSPVAPSHEEAMQVVGGDQVLADGADAVVVPFTWQSAEGVSVERQYRLTRGSYMLEIVDTIKNQSATPWVGQGYHQLVRVAPPKPKGGFTNPEGLSFVGAAWYSPQDKFEKESFADFDPRQPMKREVTDGWIAMLQHYFLAAIIPSKGEAATFSTATLPNGRYLVRELSGTISVAPGAQAQTQSNVYIGPKLREELKELSPGLDLTLDYGIFTFLAQPMHWLLGVLHSLTGNWGWAIVLLVVVIKGALFKLSEAQYRSFAKMRRVQPRIEALKERFGDDRQKFQMAMMDLYKKEKINPLGGCLPILIQIPIFLSLYWVLVEAVELRHAPWILWIQNLTAPDPYFILPVVNLLTMWATQKLSPAPGMDPIQKKMMQAMPLVFGVMFAFFPAGLVLYWTTNGLLGLLQQWYIMRRHGEPTTAVAAK